MLGYRYDSSVVPGKILFFYGMTGVPLGPFSAGGHYSVAGLMDFPVAMSPGFRLPPSGAWMRILGRRYAE